MINDNKMVITMMGRSGWWVVGGGWWVVGGGWRVVGGGGDHDQPHRQHHHLDLRINHPHPKYNICIITIFCFS